MARRRIPACVLALSAGIGCVGAGAAPAGSEPSLVRVPADFATIQEAVDAAGAYAAVIVAPGTYRGNLVISSQDATGLQIYAAGATLVAEGPDPAVTIVGARGIGLHGLAVASGGDGVVVSGSYDVAVDGLAARDVAGDGIRVEDSRVVDLEVNVVDGAGGAGVSVDHSTAVTLYQNSIGRTGGDGVALDGVWNVTVCSNTIEGCAGAGISCADSSAVVADENLIDDVGESAVDVSTTDGVSVFNNAIGDDDPATPVRGDGVRVESSTAVRLDGNWIRLVEGHGLETIDADSAIEINEIEDVGGDGVLVTRGDAGSYLAQNVVSGAGGSGIVVESASSTVLRNQVEYAGADGVDVRAGGVSVEGNDIRRPTHDGVCVMTGADDAAVSLGDNTVLRPGHDGIDVGSACGGRVAGNTVTKARRNGFEIGAAGEGNVLEGNRGAGSRRFDLFEAPAASANDVAPTNKFRHTNRRRHHRR